MKTLELVVMQEPVGVSLSRDRVEYPIDSEFSLVIGRDASCDLCLPDPKRFVSNKHAIIQRYDDQFYIEDVSTNGVYMNKGQDPIGDQPVHLIDGDVIELGDFLVRVDIIESDVTRKYYPESEGGEHEGDIEAAGQQLVHYSNSDAVTSVELGSGADSRQDALNAAPVANESSLLKALGLDPQKITKERRHALEQLGAILLKEALAGLQRLTSNLSNNGYSSGAQTAQGELRSSVQSNPFQNTPNIEQLLKVLLGEVGSGYMSPLASVRTVVDDLIDHQRLMEQAAISAMSKLIDQTTPDAFIEQLNGQTFESEQAKSAAYWQAYQQANKQMILLFSGKEGLINHLIADGYRSAVQKQVVDEKGPSKPS